MDSMNNPVETQVSAGALDLIYGLEGRHSFSMSDAVPDFPTRSTNLSQFALDIPAEPVWAASSTSLVD